MTTEQRELWNAKISVLLYMALVRIRGWTEPGLGLIAPLSNNEEIHHLTDILHNLPLYTAGLDEAALDSLDSLRILMIEHLQRFYPTLDPTEHRYVQLIDMPDDVFWSAYRDHNWPMLNKLQPSHS